MMSINGSKAVEIGNGLTSTKLYGSQNNDEITPNGFKRNNSGGILVEYQMEMILSSRHTLTDTINDFNHKIQFTTSNEATLCNLKGRHDPCIAIRGMLLPRL